MKQASTNVWVRLLARTFCRDCSCYLTIGKQRLIIVKVIYLFLIFYTINTPKMRDIQKQSNNHIKRHTKLAHNIQSLFLARFDLHKQVYTLVHLQSCIVGVLIELMNLILNHILALHTYILLLVGYPSKNFYSSHL